ncbi:AMP-binding protein [Mycolicibacterium chlorophenolicum]|uniref:Long-chain-fatty-acid--CoA ligase n=1 Tax=Mycolicibacterium chlorophenolicum TaxID=37916 RepID=A0A0J6WA51_9MYCO|nr:AMP-binding protein [Mycolicibacterium chlorophenolicum]KMO78522.1 Long-chain-fatty-acid--CoA ligase [Mycolicibacterium chlorophenolicum]
MRRLLDHLRRFADRTAVLTDTTRLTYRDLADRVQACAGELGGQRTLVLLEARNDLDALIHYLAALAAGHVVLPAPEGADADSLIATYRPGIVVDRHGVRRGDTGPHALHDDLALLMSTSGSTGSPKLVRLSHANLAANARAIAEYLEIRETDRAATTLPLSYCYGLSVIHSHLLVGAALILTDLSVAEPAFWELFDRRRGTTFAGVPYTFELLDRVGFAEMRLPHLRYVTQAGGRMPPERVRRFAAMGGRRGWDLVVMYGATEATARMAYLPADLAHSHPHAIGRPIPGGSFTIEPLDGWPDDDTGELVYRGPNVMMGYAEQAGDLALGATVDALRTGDVGRRCGPDLYEVIGRTSRFVKMFGLRIDLQRLETGLADDGVRALCTEAGDRLAVVAAGDHDPEDVRRRVAQSTGLPVTAVVAAVVTELPLLPSGKPDYPAARALAAGDDPADDGSGLTDLFADVLHLDPADVRDDATFVDLGGNSLSYVTMSVRLERALGHLPADWPRLPIRDLERRPAPRPRWWRSWGTTVETSVALRALAIVLVVGSHAELYEVWGGAHILLGIAGYNFARFCLTPLPRPERIRHLRTTIGWIALPAVVWVAFALVVTDDYHLSNLLLANKFLGPHDSMTAGRLWFVEVLVWTLVALALLFWLPVVDRLERRAPFAVAAAFLAVGMALRYDVVGLGLGHDAWFTMLAFWFFAVGWAAAKASTALQRVIVTVVLIVGVHGYFGNSVREALVTTGLVLLIWLPTMRCPAVVAVAAGAIAEASLYTYLTHFQVYPLFGSHKLYGVVASVVIGIALSAVVTQVRARMRDRRLSPRDPAQAPALR